MLIVLSELSLQFARDLAHNVSNLNGTLRRFHLGMTGSLAVKGVPRVQYVNSRNTDDEWPPKYWKVSRPAYLLYASLQAR